MNPGALVDRRFSTESAWASDPTAGGGACWVEFAFDEPCSLSAARLYWLREHWGMGSSFPAFRVLAENADGSWREVLASHERDGSDLANETIYSGRTAAWEPFAARRWRITVRRPGEVMALREVELFERVPPFRTWDSEPGDTRLRMREEQNPLVVAKNGDAVAWAASSMEKVFRDERLRPGIPAGARPVVVWAARGETEAFQVIWHSSKGTSGARANVESMAGPDTRGAGWIRINPIGYVFSRVATTDLRMSVQGMDTFFGRGFYPEVLLPERPVPVQAGKHQSFWVSVSVPRDARAGTYDGRVVLHAEGHDAVAIPFELRVWDFTLPEPADFSIRNVFTFNGYDERTLRQVCPDEASRLEYWRNLRRAVGSFPGACFSSLDPAPVRRGPDDRLSYDWEPFDRQVAWCRDELEVRHFILPFDYLAYHERLFAPSKVIGPGVEAGSERWFALLEQALTHYVGHLRERGWLREFTFFIYDEPDNTILEQCRRLVGMARRVAPDLSVILHSHPWTTEMVALDSTIVINPRHYCGPFVRRLQERGWRIWTYCNGASVVDGPPNAGRLIPWIYFKEGISGMTWHSLDDWGVTSPWEAPDRYLSWNASSLFLFPDRDNPRSALTTIRWEQWRDGMEDCEMLFRLRSVAQVTADSGRRKRAAELIARAAKVGITYGYDDPLTDAQVFEATWRPRTALPPEKRQAVGRIRPRIEFLDKPELIEELRGEIGLWLAEEAVTKRHMRTP